MDKFLKALNTELNDKAIVNALKDAINLYEDGAIVETKDILIDIINAISDFEATEVF